jgi:CBS domain containing-hemolysin-like protein
MVVTYLLLACLLVMLNGFFVLAEFAAVKMRPSRIKEWLDAKRPGATSVQHVHDHLDEFLSVCQVGITFASIGLGFVGEPAIVHLIEPWLHRSGLFPEDSRLSWISTHSLAFTISYLLVSFLHILIGELVPKSIAIRLTEQASLWTAKPLQFFRILFYLPLRILNGSANFILRWLGLQGISHRDTHSEDEIRILLNQSQSDGMMTFRRLLFLENVFDLGELRVRDAMRPRSQVQCMTSSKSWEENLDLAKRYRFSRYPLLEDPASDPKSLIHLKDMLLSDGSSHQLRDLARPIIRIDEHALLESLLAEMQKKRIHAALVHDQHGHWTGFLTLEDAIEEIIGTIRDEFEEEEAISLSETLIEDRVKLGIEADSTSEAVAQAMQLMKADSLPVPAERILQAISERERMVESYLGRHLGMPHARLSGLSKPIVMVLRSEKGIPYRATTERANLLFVLLSPAGQPRIHQRLQAIIATLLDESDYIPERLRTASSPSEIIDILRTGEQATLD